MVCPAISDPFYGRGYRLIAMGHCGVCILGFGKLYTYISLKVIAKLQGGNDRPHTNGRVLSTNGVSHSSAANRNTANNQAANGHALKAD